MIAEMAERDAQNAEHPGSHQDVSDPDTPKTRPEPEDASDTKEAIDLFAT